MATPNVRPIRDTRAIGAPILYLVTIRRIATPKFTVITNIFAILLQASLTIGWKTLTKPCGDKPGGWALRGGGRNIAPDSDDRMR